MEVYSLFSGSSGNSTLVYTAKYNLLIDCGVSMKRLNEQLMIAKGIDLEDINYLVITHSHIDHIQSFKTIYNKHKHINFIVEDIVLDMISEHFNKFDWDMDRFDWKPHIISPFELNHDVPCFGYSIKDETTNEEYVHFADNGAFWDKDMIEYLKGAEYYSIESNHDRTLQVLDNKRHEGLKRRVLSPFGHSNNYDAMQLAFKLVGENTKSILFNHLSDECNSIELATDIHQNMLAIFGKKTEFKNIKIQYGLKNVAVKL